MRIWPSAPAGIYSAGLKRKDAGFPITFGGIGSVVKASPSAFGRIDLLLIDECHLVSPKEMTMYQVVISVLKQANPFLKVIGFTATPYRMGHGMLTEPGGLFTDLCVDMTTMEAFNWFFDQGYLTRLKPLPTGIELDVTGVHTSGGEFKQNELQAAVDKHEITWAALQETRAAGHDRNHWLVFSAGIEHALHITSMLDSMGISATCVHSKMSTGERDENIAAYKAGKYTAMVNNGILTTGFDFAAIDLIAMLRPTQSTSLWVQMLGRGTRPLYADGFDLSTQEGRLQAIANGGKADCLVLDFARNVQRLGPINDPVLPRVRGKGAGGAGQAPVKICDGCGAYVHASVRFCEHCGYEFPKHINIGHHAGTDELIKTEELKVEVFKVDRVVYAEHRKDGKPPTIQVSYFCGLRMFREWVCLEHEGYPRKKARDWWRDRHMSGHEPPETTFEALSLLDELKTPTHVRVQLKKKYDEVLAYDYTGTAFNGETR
jgi:DNA repair protein RadD